MTTYYVGPGGSDGNNGQSWAQRKLTLNGAEDIPVVAGDIVIVGPGVYRELLTCDVSGGNTYSTGTAGVTNKSTAVTGSGTSWDGNVQAGDLLHIVVLDTGSDGVTNGTATFTAAGGNFDTDMAGLGIEINGKAEYHIASVQSSTSLTLLDTNGNGWPSSGSTLTYWIMSGEGSYEIDSVTDDNNLVLKEKWAGPTMTGLTYITYRPITYIGDVTGESTDGIGGAVRVTGSDDDKDIARASCITVYSRDYRVFRGFTIDMATSYGIDIDSSDYFTIEDSSLSLCTLAAIFADNTALYGTVRRCIIMGDATNKGVSIDPGSDTWGGGWVIENSIVIGGADGIYILDFAGCTVKNCTLVLAQEYCLYTASYPLGGQTIARNNLVVFGRYGIRECLDDYNCVYGCAVLRQNCTAGANSVDKPPWFNDINLLVPDFDWWGLLFSEFTDVALSSITAIGGIYPTLHDFFGVERPAGKESVGAIQYRVIERETSITKDASVASVKLNDAMRCQIFVPIGAVSTTIKVQVYRETNYAGTLPQMVIKQPGQADRTTTDTGSASQWNELSDTFTPSATPCYVVVELVSNNTASSGSYAVRFDKLSVS
jgi:hypothetical protein